MNLKIGLVLNYKKAEKKKDELLSASSKHMPWLKLAEDEKYEKYVIKIQKSTKTNIYVPDDVAVGIYIESHFKNIKVDYITPGEISKKRFKQNDIVFVLIYDLLEAFHLSDSTIFNKYKNALQGSNNVYPPYLYQKFINNKCDYYKYLENKDIPIASTFCITKEKWHQNNPSKYAEYLMKKIKKKGWKTVIAKPVYGQEAIGFEKFNCETISQKMINYLKKNVSKYKAIVFQEYIPEFDNNAPEMRTFFINGKYKYSVITYGYKAELPIQEGGKYKLSDKEYIYMIKFAKNVLKELPKIIIDDEKTASIITRIDIGSGLANVPFGFFVNEVEFVPSLYLEINKHPEKIIKSISEGLVETCKNYTKLNDKKVNVLF
jgi:hypothetical protein